MRGVFMEMLKRLGFYPGFEHKVEEMHEDAIAEDQVRQIERRGDEILRRLSRASENLRETARRTNIQVSRSRHR